ncbi:MAG: polysaccharide deacetylase family protein [Phycisphaeraceae bacterium JB051]
MIGKVFPLVLLLVGLMMSTANAQTNHKPYGRVNTDKPYVCLTFDDGPDAKMVPKLLELFAKENVKATFFVKGNNVTAFPEVAKRIIAEGHEIGNHSRTHANLPKCETVDAVREEIVSTQKIVTDTVGVTPVTFRAPYLAHDDKVWEVLDELKLPSINASQYTDDWDKKKDAEHILTRATDNIQAGDIILLHSWRQETYDVMPEMIKRIKAAGLEMVTVKTLLAAENK